jgi:hypothetical protein
MHALIAAMLFKHYCGRSNTTYNWTGRLPGPGGATCPGVFLVEGKRNHVVAVAGEESLPLVHCVHDHADSSDVVNDFAIESPE